MTRFRQAGFTIIELMIATTIVGLLASIALPKFGNMIIKAKEAVVKAKLGSLRSAFYLYYADNEGYIPSVFSHIDFEQALIPKYIGEIPFSQIPGTPEAPKTNRIIHDGWQEADDLYHYDGRLWWWVKDMMTSKDLGIIRINCTHLDSSGRIWSTW